MLAKTTFLEIAYWLFLLVAYHGTWFASLDCTFFVTYDEKTFEDEAYWDQPVRSVGLLGSSMHLVEGELHRNATELKMIWYPTEEYYCHRTGDGVEDGLAASTAVFMIATSTLAVLLSLTGRAKAWIRYLLIVAWISNALCFSIFRNCGLWSEDEWCDFGEAGVYAIVNGSLLLPGALILHTLLSKQDKKESGQNVGNDEDTETITVEEITVDKATVA